MSRLEQTFLRGTKFLVGAVLLATCAMVTAAEKDKPITIVGITLFEDLFFKDVVEGMKSAAKKNGVNLVLANANSNLATEEKIIDNYIKLGVDAIVLSPVDVNKSVIALRRAHDKGIKVVAYNETANADFLVSTIASSQKQLGASTGEAAHKYIVEKLGGQAKIAILAFDSLLPKQSDARVQGFLSTATQGLPGVNIQTRQSAWIAEKAIGVAGEIIKANPDLDIIYAANEGGTVGAQLAVKSAGMAGKIKVFGTDASKQEVNMLLAEDGILHAVTGQQPFGMGEEAVNAAVKAVKGGTVEKSITAPGILLTRDAPETIKKHKAKLESQ